MPVIDKYAVAPGDGTGLQGVVISGEPADITDLIVRQLQYPFDRTLLVPFDAQRGVVALVTADRAARVAWAWWWKTCPPRVDGT